LHPKGIASRHGSLPQLFEIEPMGVAGYSDEYTALNQVLFKLGRYLRMLLVVPTINELYWGKEGLGSSRCLF